MIRMGMAVALGMTAALLLDGGAAWWWIGGAAGAILWAVASGTLRRSAWWPLVLAAALLGGAWATLKQNYLSTNDLAGMIGDRAILVRLRGTVETTPVLRDSTSGSMAVFSYAPPSTYFRMSVDSLVGDDDAVREVRGQVLVRSAETLPAIATGSRVEVMGSIRRFPPASNPGEFNRAQYARVLGQAGMLSVPDRDLVEVLDSSGSESGWLSRLAHFRERAQRRASGWLLSNLPEERQSGRDAILSALLLGQREPDLVEVSETFRRVGLSHILAVSGLHLGIFVGLLIIIMRMTGEPRPLHAWLLIASVLVYLFLIEARLPVLRAGLMFIFANLGAALGWKIRVPSLVALSAILLLIWRPQQVFDAGFQLSYGVVLGLILFTGPLRTRWFGLRDQDAPSTAAMLLEIGKDMVAASVVAWLVATPLVAFHFGIIAPYAAIAGLAALPLVAVILALGYLKILCAAVLPSAALFLSGPLTMFTEMLIALVDGTDAIPGATIYVPHPSAAWAIAAVLVVVMWLRRKRFAPRKGLLLATAIVFVWLFWPLLPWPQGSALRIDMLAVGDGSCYLLRSGGEAVVFDAGSSTNLDAGRQTIIPAMERLGVRSIDAIVVSHANLDHISAVLELVERFSVREVLVTPQFQRGADGDLLGPAAFLLNELAVERIPVRQMCAGKTRTFGAAVWTWMHPNAEQAFRTVNDSSTVIRIDVAGRSVLLTGDIQREAMAHLLADDSSSRDRLDADVLELSHHGSYHDMAPEFVRAVDPEVAMQSTGWTRYLRDAWVDDLAGIERLITAPHGACWVEIHEDGAIKAGRYREE